MNTTIQEEKYKETRSSVRTLNYLMVRSLKASDKDHEHYNEQCVVMCYESQSVI